MEMASPETNLAPTMRNGRNHWIDLPILMLLMGVLLGALALQSAVPVGDAGGYQNMLRFFLESGRIDFMKWSQPTFAGLLPVAVPWSLIFGSGTASLQWLGIAYSLAFLAGIWVFVIGRVGRVVAALMCLSPLAFRDFASVAPTFMTDVPYLAYLMWFFVAHQRLEIAHAAPDVPSRSTRAWWILWAAMFALATLTRSFSLVLVPTFAVLLWMGRNQPPWSSRFASRCLIWSAIIGAACLIAVKLIGQNGFGVREMTALPLIFGGNMGRFNVRALLSNTLTLGLMALPFALLWRGAWPRKWRATEIAIGVLSLLLGVYFQRKGVAVPFTEAPSPSVLRAVLWLQLLLLPPAMIVVTRLLIAAARAILGRSDATSSADADDSSDSGRAAHSMPAPHTMGVLLAIIVCHLLVMPIMLHPLLRHLMPAWLALLLIAALCGIRHQTKTLAVAAVLLALMTTFNTIGASHERAVESAKFAAAEDLLGRGVPVSQIDAGWAWFCERHLIPGRTVGGYGKNFENLQRDAAFQISEATNVSDKSRRDVTPPMMRGGPIRILSRNAVKVP